MKNTHLIFFGLLLIVVGYAVYNLFSSTSVIAPIASNIGNGNTPAAAYANNPLMTALANAGALNSAGQPIS